MPNPTQPDQTPITDAQVVKPIPKGMLRNNTKEKEKRIEPRRKSEQREDGE